jgi:nucleoid-associated protein YgaU
MLRLLLFIILTSLLSSCAKPPLQEMDAAEYLVERAYALDAMEFAPTEYTAARTALNDARQAMEDKDYGDAEDSVEFALKHVRRAIIITEEGKARRAAEEARQIREEEARQAELAMEKTMEAERQKQVSKPKPKPEPKPEPKKIEPVSNYDVGEGETLWTIAAQPQVYHEGLLWPLLYQANRDQIKDPRQIFPGQTLSIRRDMTPEELEEARQTARESDIFPVP